MYIELKTERLLLRPLGISDLRIVNEYSTDMANTRYMHYLPNKSEADTLAFLTRVQAEWAKATPSYYEFAILLGGVQIGAAAVYLNEQRSEGELGCILHKKFWGNGFATEAALAVKEFAVQQLGVTKLIATCDSQNQNSARVIERIGLIFEGRSKREYADERGVSEELRYTFTAGVNNLTGCAEER